MMARDRDDTRSYGESMRSDTKPDSDEGLNRYYNRKQKTKENDVCADVDSEPAGPDRDAEVAQSDVRDKDGFINYKKWDKYGRT